MIAHIFGIVAEKFLGSIIIDVGGVGYEVSVASGDRCRRVVLLQFCDSAVLYFQSVHPLSSVLSFILSSSRISVAFLHRDAGEPEQFYRRNGSCICGLDLYCTDSVPSESSSFVGFDHDSASVCPDFHFCNCLSVHGSVP